MTSAYLLRATTTTVHAARGGADACYEGNGGARTSMHGARQAARDNEACYERGR